jgi:hypothetical protein
MFVWLQIIVIQLAVVLWSCQTIQVFLWILLLDFLRKLSRNRPAILDYLNVLFRVLFPFVSPWRTPAMQMGLV